MKIETPTRMIISLLITMTVSQPGIIPIIDRAKKQLTSRALSAIGSRYEPMIVCCFNIRAKNPSTASVIPEMVKKMRAFEKDPCIRKITTAGTRIILKSDKKLGMFMDQLLRYKIIQNVLNKPVRDFKKHYPRESGPSGRVFMALFTIS